MSNLSSLSAAQLRQAAVIQEQIETLNTELAKILNGSSGPALEPAQEAEPDAVPVKTRKKYKLSAAGKAAKIAGQKARWAKTKTETKTEAQPVKKRRKMSAEGRARIAAAAKARWARVRDEKGV